MMDIAILFNISATKKTILFGVFVSSWPPTPIYAQTIYSHILLTAPQFLSLLNYVVPVTVLLWLAWSVLPPPWIDPNHWPKLNQWRFFYNTCFITELRERKPLHRIGGSGPVNDDCGSCQVVWSKTEYTHAWGVLSRGKQTWQMDWINLGGILIFLFLSSRLFSFSTITSITSDTLIFFL